MRSVLAGCPCRRACEVAPGLVSMASFCARASAAATCLAVHLCLLIRFRLDSSEDQHLARGRGGGTGTVKSSWRADAVAPGVVSVALIFAHACSAAFPATHLWRLFTPRFEPVPTMKEVMVAMATLSRSKVQPTIAEVMVWGDSCSGTGSGISYVSG